ncbi:MAG: hypothetical protein SH857_07010 [Chitinophagales bacterium]|nr:hypothetical protein [Chitinophagales bacterium]
MTKMNVYLSFAVSMLIMTSGCTLSKRTLADSNARLQLEKKDVQISEVKSASASQTIILGVDWKRLFKKEIGEAGKTTFSIPIIGNTPMTLTESYAAYKLLKENPDFDAVLYPQYEGESKGFPFIYMKTNVTVKAKLVKVNQ